MAIAFDHFKKSQQSWNVSNQPNIFISGVNRLQLSVPKAQRKCNGEKKRKKFKAP